MRTVLVINAHSRRGRKLARDVETKLSLSKRFKIIEVIVIRDLKKIDTVMTELTRLKNIDCVLLGSGDGTVGSLLQAMRERDDLVLGFIPLGTGNAFVRSLGMPIEIDECLSALETAKPKHISLGQVNNHLFAIMAELGIPIPVANNISNEAKRKYGQAAYLFSGISQLLRHKAMHCQMTIDGKKYKFYSHHLLISNGDKYGSFLVSKKISVHKDELVVLSFGNDQSRLGYGWAMLQFVLGRHNKSNSVFIKKFKKARIVTTPIRKVEADGEIVSESPANITVIKSSFKVLV